LQPPADGRRHRQPHRRPRARPVRSSRALCQALGRPPAHRDQDRDRGAKREPGSEERDVTVFGRYSAGRSSVSEIREFVAQSRVPHKAPTRLDRGYARWNLWRSGRIVAPRVYGGARMPLTGPVPEGRTFFCPHCGALYSVTYSRLPKSESNVAKCVVCLQTMDRWDSTKAPVYKLVQRPEDA